MFITTNTDSRPLYKYTKLFNLFIFFIIMSCFVFAYPVSAEDLGQFEPIVGSSKDLVSSAGSSNVSDFTGSFSHSYPIQVPRGRGGLAPQVSLNYSSSSRNSWTGVGWDLSLGYIERSTEDGEPKYNDDDDIFMIRMPGVSGELVEEDGEYRLKDEGAFLRLVKSGDTWVVTAKSGTKFYFGENTNCKLDGGFGTFRWYLSRIVDPNGNTITYTYYQDTSNHQVYPLQISYDVNNYVRFIREGRADAPDKYNTFFRVKTDTRLKRIEVYNGGIASTNLVRKYVLNYDTSPASGRSRINSIDHYGKNNAGPLTTSFGWQNGFNGFNDKGALITEEVDRIYQKDKIFYADVTGDGMTDVITRDFMGALVVWRATGDGYQYDGVWKDPVTWGAFHFMDFDGDGKSDLIATYSSQWRVYLSTGTSFQYQTTEVRSESDNKYTHFMDVNGDGMGDIVEGPLPGGKWKVYISTEFDTYGNHLVDDGYWIEGAYGGWMDDAYNWTYSKRIRVMDVNGDRKDDIVLGPDTNGNWYVMISTGTSFVDEGVWITGAYGAWTDDSRISRTRVMEVNGDGLPDIVLGPDGGGNWYVMTSTGTSFEDKGAWISGAYGGWTNDSEIERTRAIDVNGDGKSDIVIGPNSNGNWYVMTSTGTSFEDKGAWISNVYAGWSADGKRELIQPVEFTGDGMGDIVLGLDSEGDEFYFLSAGDPDEYPDIMNTITTPLGATTSVEYVSSAKCQNTSVPYKVQIVKKITKTDNQGHTASRTFLFKNGTYNREKREFYGFGEVVVTDNVTGFITTSDYLMDDIFHGHVSWREIRDSSGVLVSQTENSWKANVLSNDTIEDVLDEAYTSDDLDDYGDYRKFIC